MIAPVKNRPHQSVRSRLVKCLAMSLSFLLALPVHAETITYQHDNNGNIIQRGATAYTYDPLNRLWTESGPAKTQTITYDENGNRKSDGTGTYTYEPTTNRMQMRRGLAVTLDAAGNITADGTGRTYSFNQARQLYQAFQNGVLLATYTYDYRGLRISKETTASAPQGAQTVVYHYDLDGKLIAETTGSGSPIRAYIWREKTPVAQIEYIPSRKIYSFNVDHLNTPRSLMDDTGKVVWRWDSDAFGSTLPNEDVDGDGVKITSNLRFPGQYYDQETGLHYNWHRYYDPSMGQYIQADPIGLAAGTNLYQYANANPLKYVDPTGLAGIVETPVGPLPLPGPSTSGQGKPKDDGSYGGLLPPGTMPTPPTDTTPTILVDPFPPSKGPNSPENGGGGGICEAALKLCLKGAGKCGPVEPAATGACYGLYLICKAATFPHEPPPTYPSP